VIWRYYAVAPQCLQNVSLYRSHAHCTCAPLKHVVFSPPLLYFGLSRETARNLVYLTILEQRMAWFASGSSPSSQSGHQEWAPCCPPAGA
jgi:hypothetical protein